MRTELMCGESHALGAAAAPVPSALGFRAAMSGWGRRAEFLFAVSSNSGMLLKIHWRQLMLKKVNGNAPTRRGTTSVSTWLRSVSTNQEGVMG